MSSPEARKVQGAGITPGSGNPVDVQPAPGSSPFPVTGTVTITQPAAVTIADGADTAEGSIADAAVRGDNPGTVNAHLRGIDAILGDAFISGDFAFAVEQSDFIHTGTISGNGQTVTQNLNGNCGAGIRIDLGGTGTVVFEGTVAAGGTFVRLCYFIDGRNADTADLSVSGGVTVTVPAAGMAQVRVRSTSWSAGSALVTMRSNATTLSVVEGSRPTSDLMVVGNITAFLQVVNLPLFGCGSAMVKISGTWTGTLQLQADCGNGVFQAWYASSVSPPSFNQNTTTQNVVWLSVTTGLKSIQIQATGAMTGTVVVNIQGCQGTPAFIPQLGYPGTSANASIGDISGVFSSIAFGSDGNALMNRAVQFLRNSANLVIARTPDVFRTVQAAAAGNTPLWTPAAGKKFRLMRFFVQVTENATLGAAGVLTVTFKDGAAGVINLDRDVWVPNVALAASGDLDNSGWIDIGNGLLSAAANNVLNVNLSAALVTGNVRITACGTEE